MQRLAVLLQGATPSMHPNPTPLGLHPPTHPPTASRSQLRCPTCTAGMGLQSAMWPPSTWITQRRSSPLAVSASTSTVVGGWVSWVGASGWVGASDWVGSGGGGAAVVVARQLLPPDLLPVLGRCLMPIDASLPPPPCLSLLFSQTTGVRLIRTNLMEEDVQPVREQLAQVQSLVGGKVANGCWWLGGWHGGVGVAWPRRQDRGRLRQGACLPAHPQTPCAPHTFPPSAQQALFDHIPVGVGSQGIIPTTARDLEEALEMGMDWSLREVRLWDGGVCMSVFGSEGRGNLEEGLDMGVDCSLQEMCWGVCCCVCFGVGAGGGALEMGMGLGWRRAGASFCSMPR